MKFRHLILPAILPAAIITSCRTVNTDVNVTITQPVHPLLTLKHDCPALRLEFINTSPTPCTIERLEFSLDRSTDPTLITGASLLVGEKPARYVGLIPDSLAATSTPRNGKISLHVNIPLHTDTLVTWLCLDLVPEAASPHARIAVDCTHILTDHGYLTIPADTIPAPPFRTGVALRQTGDDSIYSSRIPGLVTTNTGTLIAMYDARHTTDDDLQGDIDIAINRSTDGGRTWQPIQRVLDQGTYGGLPEKYNGVSDACILVDTVTGDIFVAGLWMHGVIDPTTHEWVKQLTDTSTVWNHQWRTGSKPGFDLDETCQFLITRSTDDGITWSRPRNLTRQIKKKEWWLLAPAPGRGITMSDGTLVMPVEGRDATGRQFSTIMYSRDHGNDWTVGEPAFFNVNECQVVELTDNSLMLNMRKRDNRGKTQGNGRAICTTTDMGKTWTEHPTSQSALIEPACQGGLHRHDYNRDGEQRHILIFTNPSHNRSRVNHTLKVSFDDGATWPDDHWILLDQDFGAGYSCITSIDSETIGIFYEGSQADIQFQAIPLDDILRSNKD